MDKIFFDWPINTVFCIFGKKFHDPLEICHDPLPGRDPSVEKHCSIDPISRVKQLGEKQLLSFSIGNKVSLMEDDSSVYKFRNC